MQHAPNFQLKPLPAMLAVALGSTTLNAQAVVIDTSLATVESSYSINGGATVSLSESSPPAGTANIIQSASSGGVSILTHPYVFVPSLVFGNRASGDIFGGTGSYDVNASVVLDLDVEVAPAGETFNFTLQLGEIGVTGPLSGLTGTDFLEAGLNLKIENITDPGSPQTLFESIYAVRADSSGTTAGQTGGTTSLGSCSGDSCTINAQTYSLNLDSSVTDLRYTLGMSAAGDLTAGYNDCGSFGGGSEGSGDFIDDVQFDGEREGSGNTGGPCGSIVRTGDPISSVPEPASLALGALGLAAMGLARRRRTRSEG